MSPELWSQERGAITQEVKQDDSNAFYRLFTKMQNRLIGGTPYAKNTLGTVAALQQQRQQHAAVKFYKEWYHPNNAVYVIAGNVDPQQRSPKCATFRRRAVGDSCRRASRLRLRRCMPALYHDTSDQAFTGVALGYRFPGYDSPDYAAGQILSDVLTSQRSDFGGLPFTGKALGTQFFTQDYPKDSASASRFGAVPVNVPPQTIAACCAPILENYQKDRRSRRSWSKRQSSAKFPRSSSTATRSRDKPSNGVRRWRFRALTRPTT